MPPFHWDVDKTITSHVLMSSFNGTARKTLTSEHMFRCADKRWTLKWEDGHRDCYCIVMVNRVRRTRLGHYQQYLHTHSGNCEGADGIEVRRMGQPKECPLKLSDLEQG